MNEDDCSATCFDSIYTLEVWVLQYPLSGSSLLCLTGTCSVHYINICWYCWSTHEEPMFHLYSGNKYSSFPSRTISDLLSPVSALCLPPRIPLLSWFLIIKSARRKGSFGMSALQPAQNRINTEFRPHCSGIYSLRCWKSIATDSSQPLWVICFSGWLSPWCPFTHFLLRFWLTHSSC